MLSIVAAIVITNAATAVVPLAAMTETNRAVSKPVVHHYTLRREYPVRTFPGRRKHFEFLMDNLQACSILSERLGLISYRAEEKSPGIIFADDRAGAQGILQQVYCTEGKRIYYVEGSQRGAFSAHGRGLVVVTFAEQTPGTIEYAGKIFVKVDNKMLAALAQMFFVFVKSTVDQQFDNVMSQPIHLSRMALEEPAMLLQCIAQMPPEDYRQLAPLADALRR